MKISKKVEGLGGSASRAGAGGSPLAKRTETNANRSTLRTAVELVEAGLLPHAQQANADAVAARYAIAVTPAVAELIDRADSADPIARQYLPSAAELRTLPQELADPIGDHAKSPVKGIVHRYPDRVLLKLTGVCAVYCRFCFRREMVGPGHEATLPAADLAAALDYIRATPAIWEVIVTGGDPLMASARRIAELVAALDAIPHVKVVRWHTRLPVAAPERVTTELAAAVGSARRVATWVAIHANHARELTPAARAACDRLGAAGCALVSQSVLLRGVNDDVESLDALMRAFVEARIKPYYLHHGDLAPGTSHFRTTLAQGQALMAALRQRLSGLAMPTYVLDLPGGDGKVPAGPAHVGADGAGVVDQHGRPHPYRDVCEGP